MITYFAMLLGIGYWLFGKAQSTENIQYSFCCKECDGDPHLL
jgi:hypothetical protein